MVAAAIPVALENYITTWPVATPATARTERHLLARVIGLFLGFRLTVRVSQGSAFAFARRTGARPMASTPQVVKNGGRGGS